MRTLRRPSANTEGRAKVRTNYPHSSPRYVRVRALVRKRRTAHSRRSWHAGRDPRATARSARVGVLPRIASIRTTDECRWRHFAPPACSSTTNRPSVARPGFRQVRSQLRSGVLLSGVDPHDADVEACGVREHLTRFLDAFDLLVGLVVVVEPHDEQHPGLHFLGVLVGG